jgi:CIC family chloride channel protein
MQRQGNGIEPTETDNRQGERTWRVWHNFSWAGLLRRILRLESGFRTSYLRKWLLLSVAIGVVAGLGAIAFYLAIELATKFLLGSLVGYLPPSPAGEGGTGLLPITRAWLLPIVTALGGLISGLIVFNLAPEAEGHGTDAAIAAIHHNRGRIRARIPPIKLIASAFTIGSGGSGGREGPAAQISAGFGSLLGDWLKLDAQDRRIAVAAGVGAGIGAIFRAPLGGAVLAAEILYVHDLEVEALIPGLMASIVGYSIYGAYFGFMPIFGDQPSLIFKSPVELVYYAALGIICGLVGILYARSFYGIGDFFRRLSLPPWLKPALAGLLVGALGILLPGALHMGYGWLQIGMSSDILGIPLWVILVLPFAKILATSLSIGSGGSGGIFGPGMVIGGMLGASLWRLTQGVLPQVPSDPAPFVIVGMMAMFGGIAHAPLAVMLMVAEMTGNLSLLAPAMIAVAISTALVGDNTIYRSQLPNRASAPAHRVRFSFPLLSSILVRDAMRPPLPTIREDAPLSVAESLLPQDDTTGVVVVDEHNQLIGTLTRQDLLRVPLAERATKPIREALRRAATWLEPDQTLDKALEQLAEMGLSWAPVVQQGQVVGHVHVRDIATTYKSTLQRSVRRASTLPLGTTLFEVRLGPRSRLCGRTLNQADLPKGTLVVSIIRDGEVIFPRATTKLEAGDVVMVMTDPAREGTVRSFLEGPAASA